MSQSIPPPPGIVLPCDYLKNCNLVPMYLPFESLVSDVLCRCSTALPSHPGSLSAIAADIIKRTRNGQNQDDQAGKVLPGPSRLYPEICRCYEVRPPMLKPHQTHTSRSEFFAWTALSAPTLRGFPPPQLSISFYLAK